MKFWNSSTSTTGDEKENTSNGKYIPPTPCESQRFYYESGDDGSQLKLFKGLSPNINKTLRSLFLERCTLHSSVFLSSLQGCEILTSIKLYDVSIEHDESDKNPQKLTLPSLKVLHIHDLLSDSTVKEISFDDKPFDKILDPQELARLEKFVHFHVKFYLQLLRLRLPETECKSLLCKFHNSDVDFSLKLKGYQIMKYSPLEQYEKLVISPLVPGSAYPPHCSNGSHQLFSQLKYLACSDHHLSLSTTPKHLVELNLYVTTSKTATLIVDLATSQKLSSSLTSLTLHLKTATIIDLKMLTSGLGSLEELVIVNGIVHSTATSPLTVTTACFDRCSFSEAFMKNVGRFLNCERIGIDVGGIRNWNGVFKSNIMSMSAVRSIFVWAVDEEDKITFSEIFEKKPKSGSSHQNNPIMVWVPRKFEDIESRRYILLNQRDFYPPPKTGVFQPNLFGAGKDVPYSNSASAASTIPAFTDKSNMLFSILVAVGAIIFYIYSGFLEKKQ